MKRRRPGAVLAEMIVALGISGLVAALAVAAMLAAERRWRTASFASDAARLEQEVESVLRSEIRGSLGDSLVPRGDTAIDLLAHVGSSVVCSWGTRVLTLPPAQSSTGRPLSRWRYTPAAGDLLYVYDTTSLGWRRYLVDSALSRVDPAGCLPATGFQTRSDSVFRRPVTRVVVASALPLSTVVGTPVRIVRRGRWGLVRGTDKSWELAYRGCDLPGHCGGSQPVAGPLAAPADSGLRFRVLPTGVVDVTVRAAASKTLGRGPLTVIVPPMTRSVP
ncbi:MAG: hypothetical protein NTU67_03380 [Gemmatimonadetes bacterium]|nr:hypothetical protein [Gemmatimonadota bacterium]